MCLVSLKVAGLAGTLASLPDAERHTFLCGAKKCCNAQKDGYLTGVASVRSYQLTVE